MRAQRRAHDRRSSASGAVQAAGGGGRQLQSRDSVGHGAQRSGRGPDADQKERIMKAWFAALAPRERTMVLLAAVMATLGLGYVALWEPLVSGVVRLEQSVQAQRELKAWMTQAAAEAQRLRAAGAGQGPAGGDARSLLTVIAEAVQQAQFDDMLMWLVRLQLTKNNNNNKQTKNRREQGGRVNARVTLKREGS